jgi:biopolymer transport protein ExbB/TolQ
MSEFNFLNKKINIYYLVWVVILFLLLSVVQCSRNIQLKRDVSKVRKELKKDYEKRIQNREKEIKKLRTDNDLKRKYINELNFKIDSLEKVKNKVHIKYVEKKNEIKSMDSEKIKNYWNEQFN